MITEAVELGSAIGCRAADARRLAEDDGNICNAGVDRRVNDHVVEMLTAW